ncbi:MAG: hypothetical protein EWM72_00441 [Nitrospira sp.]|nr:MAG: hypothetical protein EWM72_00441 [Nitrospira sp.]
MVKRYDKESGVGVKETAARSGAQDEGEERAEETAATVTETSKNMLRRWRGSVNRPSTRERSQVAGTRRGKRCQEMFRLALARSGVAGMVWVSVGF